MMVSTVQHNFATRRRKANEKERTKKENTKLSENLRR
jgi:hypothetical protein